MKSSIASRVVVVSTNPNDIKGGISKSVNGILSGLKTRGVRVDVIVSHETVGGQSAAIKRLLRSILVLRRLVKESEVPVVIYVHAGGIVSILRKLILIMFSSADRRAVVLLHLHSPTIKSITQSRLQSAVLQMLLNRSVRVLMVADWWKNYMQQAFPGHDYAVLGNPVHIDQVLSFVEANAERRFLARRVMFMSRLVEGKGADLVLGVAEALPSFVFVVAGDGPLRKQLTQALLERRLNNVIIKGWLNEEAKATELQSASAFLLPSTRDSFGMGYIEAMAEGLPCVGLNIEAIPSVASGVLVPHVENYRRQVEHLAAAVLEIFSSFEAYQSYSRAAYEKALSFSVPAVTEQLVEILDSVEEKL